MRILLISIGFLWFGTLALAVDPAHERFETRIRPLLAEQCISCHGPTKQASGLRLDTREAMLKGGDTEGPAIIAGNADASPLIKAIRHKGDVKMPPKSKLADPLVNEMAEWIKAGAPWPQGVVLTSTKAQEAALVHWSFKPILKPTPPADSPGISAIDAFVRAELKKQNLTPAGRADRRTLIRRATFDLIGIPPTSDEVEAFLGDARPDAAAFAGVVERLLASPHYGERWGRFWLDVARYGDTKGYVFTEDKNYPFAYTYRDWVINAFNSDLPYDQFIQLQLAADKLPHGPDNRSLAAMGFLTVGRRFLQDQNEIIDDRIDVVSRGLLGLSVTCARCHDHKFDPIPSEDYYSLYGVFASSEEPKDLPLISSSGSESERVKDLKDYEKKIAERKTARDDFLTTKRADLEKELTTRFTAYLVAAEELDFNARDPRSAEVARVNNLRPELIRRISTRWRDRLNADDPRLAPWKVVAKLKPEEYPEKAAALIRGTKANPSPAPAAMVRSLASTPIASRKELAKRYGDLIAKSAKTTDKNLIEIKTWLDSADGPLKIADADMRRVVDRVDRNKLLALEKKVAEIEGNHPGAPAKAMVMVDKAQLYEPHVFIRGNPGRPGKQIPRRFLKVLSTPERPAFKTGSGRLDLAKSIVDPKNPLTSRVIVNRIWMNHFGKGLVQTPSDFGLRGDPPTHPALLDWLASTFMANGWSIKSMHRMIMATDVYQAKSDTSEVALKQDPRNTWLSHQTPRRLDFEAMRDSLLAVSGRLDTSLGGKAVPLEAVPEPTRRAIYGYVDRYNLDPTYRTFDFPNPDSSSPKRATTTVPQQALYLLNSPFVAEQAKFLASRPELESGTSDDRIKHLYEILFNRAPDARELQLAQRFLTRPKRADDQGPTSPWSFGWGAIVETAGKPAKTEFKPFPTFAGRSWQLEEKLPSASGSFASLNRDGGHPGPDGKNATIIRWTAPIAMDVVIAGTLRHESKQGDGVRGRVVSSRSGLLGAWAAKGSGISTDVPKVHVEPGDTIDFVVDCVTEPSFDSYLWDPVVRDLNPASNALRVHLWKNFSDFHGPETVPFTSWEAYTQALMLSNEFLYID